jgi:predicted ATPase
MEFTAAEIAAGLEWEVEAVEEVCEGLSQQGRFLSEQGLVAWPDGTVTVRYLFRHAVHREVVYGQLGQGQRVRWHRRVGGCLEAGYGKHTQEVSHALALHFERGWDVGRAALYRQQVVEQALSRSAYPEAQTHAQHGLALLETLPEATERTVLELALRTSLSVTWTATHGYDAPGLEQNLQRARALCRDMDATEDFVPILVGLTRLFLLRSDREATESLMAHKQALLERTTNVVSQIQLYTQLGVCETFRGAHAQAEAYYSKAIVLYDPAEHQSLILKFGMDPSVSALAVSSWSLWLMGYPDQAWSRVERALVQAEALAQPFSLITTLFNAVVMRQLRGELDVAWVLAQRLVALGHEQGFRLYTVGGIMTQGSILLQQGDMAHGRSLLTTGMAEFRRLGAQQHLPFFFSFLAVADLRQGRIAEGVQVIDEALRLTDTNFDRFWEAELYRLKGELLWAQIGPGADDVSEYFHQALAIAQQQGAKALELRAVMSLSRLWQTQGKHCEACRLLVNIYDRFTEGFDTGDLQMAKALLAALE